MYVGLPFRKPDMSKDHGTGKDDGEAGMGCLLFLVLVVAVIGCMLVPVLVVATDTQKRGWEAALSMAESRIEELQSSLERERKRAERPEQLLDRCRNMERP